MLGNFQHNPDRAARTCSAPSRRWSPTSTTRSPTVSPAPTDGLINALLTAEVDGDRLTEEEIVANVIVTMVGGQETTTNLIGNGLLTLLRQPDELRAAANRSGPHAERRWRNCSATRAPASTPRGWPPTTSMLGGKKIREGNAVIAVMGAGNRDPERFPDPDRLDLTREDNRHLAFGWAASLLLRRAAGADRGPARLRDAAVPLPPALPG